MTTLKEQANLENPGFAYKAQNGEDVILKYIFERLENPQKTCLEFGAADGLFCSNTTGLWKYEGWSAVLIESDYKLYTKLLKNVEGQNVRTYNATVTNVDHFAEEPLDFVSIDVDGRDYQVWEATTQRHRVICIEYNPTFPPHAYYVGDDWMGSSALSIYNLAKTKGYELAAVTKTNMIFVRDEDADFLKEFNTRLEDNFDYQGITYVVTDYHGNFDLIGRPPYSMVWKANFGTINTKEHNEK